VTAGSRHTAQVTTATRAPDDPRPGPGASLRVGAWVLYDVANTVYSATLTFLFTSYAKTVLGGELKGVGLVQFGSMVLAGLLVPLLGALSDQTRRTRAYLTIATLACIAGMAGFGCDFGGAWLLGCFFVANITYNLGLLFYNALLPAVAPAERAGRVSGLGVGFGYIGTLAVLVVFLPPAGTRPDFFGTAATFLVLAMPCLLLVRDRRPPRSGSTGTAMRDAVRSLRQTLRELPRHRALAWFLLGNFCLVDVLNTAILYFADFTTEVFRAPVAAGSVSLFGHAFAGNDGLTSVLRVTGFALNGLALPFGILLGRWTDRAPLGVMRVSAIALLLALIGGAAFGGESLLGYLLTLGVLGAFGLSGIWTAGRKMVLLLAPPDQTGEYFGLYGITLKLSVLGSVVYAFLADAYGCKPAMLAQGVQLLVGLGCLAMVRLPTIKSCWTLP